jgi:hypothetical protein
VEFKIAMPAEWPAVVFETACLVLIVRQPIPGLRMARFLVQPSLRTTIGEAWAVEVFKTALLAEWAMVVFKTAMPAARVETVLKTVTRAAWGPEAFKTVCREGVPPTPILTDTRAGQVNRWLKTAMRVWNRGAQSGIGWISQKMFRGPQLTPTGAPACPPE